MELDVGGGQARRGCGRTRTTSATVDVSGPRAAQQPLRQGLGLVGAVERRRSSETSQSIVDERVVLEVAADARAGRGAARRRPRAARRPAPMPDSSSSCGEPIAPAQRITSRSRRRTCLARRACRGSARRPRGRRRARGRATVAPVTHLEVRALHRRAQEGVGGAPAAAVLLGDLEHRDAVLLGPVVVVDARDAGGRAGVEQPRGRAGAASAARRRAAGRPTPWNSDAPRSLSSERRK